ncbi:MAG TPA: MauE/DoxX family redox-associated membrane protein [Acidimicrobiia bacterium]|nr:MauE/DoxX family redox-associated membrane protein [Acidimicrobiia bacterium]
MTSGTAVSAGPYLAICALLVGSGVQKLRRPAPARAALWAAGARVPTVAVLGVGAVEIGAGVIGAAWGRVAAVAVALAYAALAAFALRLWRRAPSTPCGCLGSGTATVTPAHLFVDVAAVCVAVVAARNGPPLAHLAHAPFTAAVFVALVGCCVALLTLTLDALPALQHVTKDRQS